MESQDVPASQWPELLDQFSRRHHGQDVHVEILGPGIGLHQEADGIPLLGVIAEPGSTGDQKIDVMAGGPRGTLISHAIEHPSRIRLCEWNDGISAELEIEARDGHLTRVRVGPPAQTLPPDSITDGLYERY